MSSDLESYLSGIGMGTLSAHFTQLGCDKSTLLHMGEEDLKKSGINDPEIRHYLIACFQQELAGAHDASGYGWTPAADPEQATKESPFMNSLGMLFVPIPRYKTLFSVTQVRICDYQQYCETRRLSVPQPDFEQDSTHPVVNVSWLDAEKFCEWLTKREHDAGVVGPDLFYRLPTDMEWSAAVGLPNEPQSTPKSRNGKLPGYPWGVAFPPYQGAGNYSEVLAVDPFRETSPVASFAPNDLGIYDMGGNVWEWCKDAYDLNSEAKVARGASCFNDGEDFLRSSYRDAVEPRKTKNNLGFRVVLSPGLLKDPLHRIAINPWG